MSLDLDAWKQFATDHWVLIVVAVIVLIVVINVVKTLLKWVLVAAIVVGLAVYGGYSVNDLKEVGSKVTADLKDEAVKAMAGEASQATYKLNGDGTFTVTTPNLELSGVPNSGKVNVKFRGVSLGSWSMDGAVRELVAQAREASQ
ncbi:hypothetical protein [Cohnella zeiphila]|uniref:Uncharacterized protein n=1 Tax=Cohnella zeiphila TaxID=2761120 RepID=A0A7X0SIX1_9BACL|nr:hypothetical protein [Cohnella zeiphila]MBB6730721.1 hypothetical protein [Cohnella zeiphila]